jgi:putative transposase
MGKPYADDLRLVVVRLIEEGHTRPEAAELCGISLSSVGRYLRRYRTTGSVRPEKFGGYKGYALSKHAERIERWVAEQPDLTLLEIQARLAKAKVKVAASSVFRFLRHLGLTFKKKSSTRPSRIARTSPPCGGAGGAANASSIRNGWCSLMRRRSPPG